jgi:phosphatidylserine/phosphatidylglycerophosphate/cardiolipin synthase-like enzyme
VIAAKEQGVDVALKLDKVQSAGKSQKAQIQRLLDAGIRTEVSQLSRLLHDKFMVVDGKKVWTAARTH